MFWIVTSTLFWGIEVSVFVFLFSSDVSSAKQLIKRVAFITMICMTVFAVVQVRQSFRVLLFSGASANTRSFCSSLPQSLVVFLAEIRIYEYTPLSLYWWAPFNAVRALSYIVIILLPIMPCRRRIALPSAYPSFMSPYDTLIFQY